MAEVRKFKPGQNAIAEAIQKAMGEGVRPVTPGGPPKPAQASTTGAPATAPITAATFFVNDFSMTASDEDADSDD